MKLKKEQYELLKKAAKLFDTGEAEDNNHPEIPSMDERVLWIGSMALNAILDHSEVVGEIVDESRVENGIDGIIATKRVNKIICPDCLKPMTKNLGYFCCNTEDCLNGVHLAYD